MRWRPHVTRTCPGLATPPHDRGSTLHPLNRSRHLVAAAALLLTVGACSGGGGDDEATAETTVPTTRPILTTTLPTTTLPDLDGTVYVVQSGDTFGRIAADHGISLDRLLTFNNLSPSDVLQPGYKLLIPTADGQGEDGDDASGSDEELPLGARTYVLEAGDTFNAIAERFEITLDELLAANDISADTVLHPGAELIIPAAAPSTTVTTAADTTTSGG